jgi:hypothetical protein
MGKSSTEMTKFAAELALDYIECGGKELLDPAEQMGLVDDVLRIIVFNQMPRFLTWPWGGFPEKLKQKWADKMAALQMDAKAMEEMMAQLSQSASEEPTDAEWLAQCFPAFAQAHGMMPHGMAQQQEKKRLAIFTVDCTKSGNSTTASCFGINVSADGIVLPTEIVLSTTPAEVLRPVHAAISFAHHFMSAHIVVALINEKSTCGRSPGCRPARRLFKSTGSSHSTSR